VTPRRHRRVAGGFALVLTLALVALLVLVILALASLARVNARATETTLGQVAARQNARFALEVALAHLQRHAGPDSRVTATAEAVLAEGDVNSNRHYTGVWDVALAPSATPITWLVSGNEGTNPRATTPDFAGGVELVGHGSTTVSKTLANGATARNTVVVPLVALTDDAFPGQPAGTVTGGYAWWVGDLGVRASLGLADRVDEVNYAPWDTPVQRQRIRQQLAATPNYFRNSATARQGFDPRSWPLPQSKRLLTAAQFTAFPGAAGAAAPLATFLREHHFDFTFVAASVLANTRTDAARGLMRDLSLAPGLLGPAFAAYADYPGYMESPDAGAAAVPPITSGDSPRRRYRLTPPVESPAADGLPPLAFSVAPVITDFLLQFGLNRPGANLVNAKARLYLGLWNPYSAALVPPAAPDELTLEIRGLPALTPLDSLGASGAAIDLQASLPAALAGPDGALVVKLPFGVASSGSASDRASWLPGRLYFWTTPTGASPGATLQFYDKNISAAGWAYPAAGLAGAASSPLGVSVPAASGLTLTLKSKAGVLATYRLPAFLGVELQPSATASWKFGYSFRLAQPSSLDSARTWLQDYDPREPAPPLVAFDRFDPNLTIPSVWDPAVYNLASAPITSQHLDQYLLYRTGGTSVKAVSANNDVPLFELPRLPLLSVGELQHLRIPGRRPFAIGNAWGGAANGVFDRFFFSGLPATGSAPDLALGVPPPNWNLAVVEARAASSPPLDLATVRDGLNPLSSRFLLQRGGFNVNAVSRVAWRAVLSGVRFLPGGGTLGEADAAAWPLRRAEISNVAGTATLGSQAGEAVRQETFAQDATLGLGEAAPVFLRFPQSAQETYYWEPGLATRAQQLSTQTYRMGVRGANASVSDPARPAQAQYHHLTTDQLEELAGQIAALVAAKARRPDGGGPYRTMEEFLAPRAPGAPSLLEEAIDRAGLNPRELTAENTSLTGPGFGSLTLTPADLLTALAPYLKTRSDTFVIRAYGEHVNPATGRVGFRAWAEATVQRYPDPVDPTDDMAQPAAAGLGRRFRISSFRWLNPSEI